MSDLNNTIPDEWETTSGLLDDFAFTITNAWFATDARYNNGETILLHLEGTTDNPDTPETIISYPVGSGWESNDGGKTVDGKDKFNKQSWYGRFIDACVKELGLGSTLAKRGNPKAASTWLGLSFQMKEKEFNYGGEIGVKSRLMPVKFLGEGGAAPAATAAPVVEIPAELDKTLRDLVAASSDHGAFVAEAMKVPDVSSNADLLSQVVDAGDTGLYAKVKAELANA